MQEPALPAPPRTTGQEADSSLGSVEVNPDGKIAIRCNAVEIGNGVGTAVANRVAAILGAIADEVAVARIDSFGALGLVTSFDPYTISQENQDVEARNPALGPGDQLGKQRFDWRTCRDARSGGGGARHLPFRPVACCT